jgi:DNA-binding response OmpR family regulator
LTRRVLVADTPEGDRRIAAILAGYELEFVRTLDAARRALQDDGFALVLIGVHFDDSRMFDLLRYMRANPEKPGRCVVCMRSQRFASTAITIEGLEIAAKTLGCALFLDLTWYAEDANGNQAVRSLLDALITAAP